MNPITTRLLASIRDRDEALLVARHGADIIDLKNPAAGALGAVDAAEMTSIVKALQGRHVLSATIGDQLRQATLITEAVYRTAATGVDIVKVGWFDTGVNSAVIDCLTEVSAAGVRVVVVLFAEHGLQLDLLPTFASAGLYGVMLDTVVKHNGSLRDKLNDGQLVQFVETARSCQLLCGLAGSLKQDDISPLLALAPDYLGFRGALCRAGQRVAALDKAALESVRRTINTLTPAQATACVQAS